MNSLLAGYLNVVFDMEESGQIEQALQYAEILLDDYPEEKADIYLEKGKLEFRNEMYGEALEDFISAYEISGSEEVLNLILETYYEPNKEELETTKKKNDVRLERYPYYKSEGKEKETDLVAIWNDEIKVVGYDRGRKHFSIYRHFKLVHEIEAGVCLMLVDVMSMETIQQLEKQSRCPEKFLDQDNPLYLVYSEEKWELFRQLYDIESLMKTNRVVFLIGWEGIKSWFSDATAVYPDLHIYDTLGAEVVNEFKEKIYQKAILKYRERGEIVKKYYEENKKNILERVKNNKCRVLFFTSRFTTVLQYHTRDCLQATQKLGLKTELLIESDGIHSITNLKMMEVLDDFKPDIIFCIDHFHSEWAEAPEEIVWITWVQDPMPRVMSKKTPGELGKRDFVMNHFTTWKTFAEIGYPEYNLIEAPIPASEKKYHPYELTEEEKEKYSCDICFVCHASDVDNHLNSTLEKIEVKWRQPVEQAYRNYQKMVYESGKIFYGEQDFKDYLKEQLSEVVYAEMGEKLRDWITNDMFMWFNQRVFRQALVDWIIEAGFTNIKLWGNGWKDSPKYTKYAMGVAQNGEELSKIYQTSKIVLGNNIMTTSAARAWETMLSGGFYICNYIPEKMDVTDIRRIVEVGKDVEMFYDKTDLLEKITFYLEHEEERQMMIERGRKVALEKMTFQITMERTFSEIRKRLEEAGE